MIAWMDEHTGAELPQKNNSTITVWTWAMVAVHPIDRPNTVIAFAHQQHTGIDPDDEHPQYALAVDLQAGVFQGAVVRGKLEPGNPPTWKLLEPLETLAAGFEQWRLNCLTHTPKCQSPTSLSTRALVRSCANLAAERHADDLAVDSISVDGERRCVEREDRPKAVDNRGKVTTVTGERSVTLLKLVKPKAR